MYLDQLDLDVSQHLDWSHRNIHRFIDGSLPPPATATPYEKHLYRLANAAHLIELRMVGIADRYGTLRSLIAPVVLLEGLGAPMEMIERFQQQVMDEAPRLMPDWLNCGDKSSLQSESETLKAVEAGHVNYLTPVIERAASVIDHEDPVRYSLRSARIDSMAVMFAVEAAIYEGYARDIASLRSKLEMPNG